MSSATLAAMVFIALTCDYRSTSIINKICPGLPGLGIYMGEFTTRLAEIPTANAGILVNQVTHRYHVNTSLNYKQQRDLAGRIVPAR